MLLTFKRHDHGIRAYTPAGAELFSIAASTGRGDEALVVHTDLPRLDRNTRVELPEGVSKYGPEGEALAMRKCVELLTFWMANVLGIDVTADPWNGIEYDPVPPKR